MIHGIDTSFLVAVEHEVTVTDISLLEHMQRIIEYRRQRVEIARVSESIDVNHACNTLGNKLPHETASDEAGAACDEDGFQRASS